MKKYIMMTLFATCLSMPAMANDPDMKKGDAKDMKNGMISRMMDKMDTNNDSFVSKEEHDAFSDKKFADADSNKDGKLSSAEMMDAADKWYDKTHEGKGDMKGKDMKGHEDDSKSSSTDEAQPEKGNE